MGPEVAQAENVSESGQRNGCLVSENISAHYGSDAARVAVEPEAMEMFRVAMVSLVHPQQKSIVI